MAANTGFRLGEEHFSDASDSDQSQTSRPSSSPKQANGQVHHPPARKSKNKKQKDRRQMGALAEELVDVLGGAFSASDAGAQAGKSRAHEGEGTLGSCSRLAHLRAFGGQASGELSKT